MPQINKYVNRKIRITQEFAYIHKGEVYKIRYCVSRPLGLMYAIFCPEVFHLLADEFVLCHATNK